jgi:hypothetical protein
MEYCASEDWRRLVQDTILPVTLGGVALGDDVLEIGPGPGFTTGVLRTQLHHIAPAAQQDRVFAELARVLAPGGVLVAAEGVYSEDTTVLHENDTYNPIDPEDLSARLGRAGFTDAGVHVRELGWVCTARTRAGA